MGTESTSDLYQYHLAIFVEPAGTTTNLSILERRLVHIPGAQPYGKVEVPADHSAPERASGEVRSPGYRGRYTPMGM